jgi:2-polyprenyl-6-methoxyphenol hydroxylase-like FAD-dependent oxidoreductase
MYAAYWTVPRLPSDNNWWNIYFALQSRIITIRPDPHGTVRAMLTCMPRNEDQKKLWLQASKGDRQMQEKLLKTEFADAGWQAQRLLKAMAEAPDFYFQAVKQVKMSRWSKSRVVCVGDAAYAPTPLTGMGTSLAITGAYVLAGELSKLMDSERVSVSRARPRAESSVKALVKALEAYEITLRPFVEQTQKIPFFVPAIAHPKQAWKRWLFHTAARAISAAVAIPYLSNRFSQGKKDPLDSSIH